MGEVAAVVQVHAQHRVPHVAQGLVDGIVGGSAAVGLNVHVVSAEEGLGPVPGDVFHHVHALTAAVIPLAGVSFGILVGEHRGGRCQHGFADKVLRGDELNVSALAVVLRLHGVAHLGVLLDQKINNIFDHDTRSFSCTVNFGVAGFPLRKVCRQREKSSNVISIPIIL